MKIQNTPATHALTHPDKAKSKPLVSELDSKKTKVERLDKYSAEKRISQWFSQVGVGLNEHSRDKNQQDDRLEQRRKLMAQRKLNNLEAILGKALDFCLDGATQENIDADWFFSFVNMAEDIYSAPMQDLWGKIFAVETSRPGSFTLKTLQILKQLTHKDAQVFRKAVSLASRSKLESTPKLLIGYYQKSSIWSFMHPGKEQHINLAEFGLVYPDLLTLMDLGLIHHSEIETGELNVSKRIEWRCAGVPLHIAAKRKGLSLVYYKFTTPGAELSRLISGKKHGQYLEALKKSLQGAFELY